MEKKKIGLIIFALMILIASTIAWDGGNILTPEQFADKDLTIHDYNPTPQNARIIADVFLLDILTNSFEKNQNEFNPVIEGYEEKRKTLIQKLKVSVYSNCRAESKNEKYCEAVFKEALLSKSAKSIISEDIRLKQEQKEIKNMNLYASELNPEDISITQAEINAKIAEIKTG